MDPTMQVRWWNYESGSEYMATQEESGWTFAEREWGGVRWYSVHATPELCEIADLLFAAEQQKQMCVAASASACGVQANSDHQSQLAVAAA